MHKLISVTCMILFLMMFSFAHSALGEESKSVVYYNPAGGQYYNAKPECVTMSRE